MNSDNNKVDRTLELKIDWEQFKHLWISHVWTRIFLQIFLTIIMKLYYKANCLL